jgi:hypothetical protein
MKYRRNRSPATTTTATSFSGPWLCDTCALPIRRPKHGMLVWFAGREGYSPAGPWIVHHLHYSPWKKGVGCYPTGSGDPDAPGVSDRHLPEVLGNDGLISLLELGEDQRLPEINKTIMRLHVAGYERARPYFPAAICENVVEPNMAPGYFTVAELEQIARWGEGRLALPPGGIHSARELREWMTEGGLTDEWVASATGTSPSTVRQVRRGQGGMPIGFDMALNDALELDVVPDVF